jgi:hypothetical protein
MLAAHPRRTVIVPQIAVLVLCVLILNRARIPEPG